MDPFINIPNHEPPAPSVDVLLNQQYQEGNLSDPAKYFTSKQFFRVTVGQQRGAGVDTTDIQTAIERVHTYGKGVVLIRDGTYIPPTLLTLYSDIEIIGESATGVIIDFNTTSNYLRSDPAATGMNPVSNIAIENITFKNSHNSQGVIYLENVNKADFDKLSFVNNYTGTTGYDFYIKDSSNIYIDRVDAISATFLYTNNAYRVNINNVIATCAYRGINGKVDGVGLIKGNITNSTFAAQYAAWYGTLQDVLFTNTDLTSATNEPGVYILSTSEDVFNGTFLNCNISGKHEGALVDGTSASIEGIRFTDCNITGATGYDGIKLITANKSIITNCDLFGNVSGGHYSLNISNVGCNNTRLDGNIYNNDTQSAGTNYHNSGTKTSS